MIVCCTKLLFKLGVVEICAAATQDTLTVCGTETSQDTTQRPMGNLSEHQQLVSFRIPCLYYSETVGTLWQAGDLIQCIGNR